MQEADIDTIKFCVSLINKLKKNEKIDVSNKLIKAGLESIKNGGLKVLIQAQSCNDNRQNGQVLEQIQRKAEIIGKDAQTNRQECLSNRMIKLKLKALLLMKTMRQNQVGLSVLHAREIKKIITNLKEMKFVFELLFKVASLHQLQVLNVSKTNISHLTVQQQEIFLYIVALIKLESRKDEAQDIILNQLKNKYKKEEIQKQKKAVLAVINVLLQKQRQLLKQWKPQQFGQDNSRILYCQSTRKIIKNKFFFQYKIDLDLSMAECQKRVSSLDQKSYLLASPLFNFYFQNNQEIVQKLSLTQIHKKISIAKSVLLQSMQLNSTNGKTKTKFKFRYARNPQLYRKYTDQTISNNEKYEKSCAQGQLFIKYNYNNLYSASKFAIFTKEMLAWGKNKAQVQKKSTKIKTKKVLGIIYGKVTERFQEQAEIGPCFSFLLKDRTVDLSVPKQKTQALHRFILGANSIISSNHFQEAQKNKQQGQILSNNTEMEDKKNKVSFHQSKNQLITKGKLLWRDFFTSMAGKAKKIDKELFAKAKCISYIANKEALSNSKLSLRNKLSLDQNKIPLKQGFNKRGS